MFRTLSAVAAAILIGLFLSGGARAQNAVGDWVTTIAEMHFVFHIKKDDKGALVGLGDVYEQGSVDLPLAAVTEKADVLVIDAPSMNSRFEGKWNAAKQQWDGKYTLLDRLHAVSLVRSTGKFPSTDLKLGSDLDGLWEGIIKAPGNVELPLAFTIETVAGKTEGVLELRQQRVRQVPVTGASRNAPRVKLEIAGFDSAFEGKISDDKQTIAGAWHQAGNALPLTVKRRAKAK